jgi:hypothetical protein
MTRSVTFKNDYFTAAVENGPGAPDRASTVTVLGPDDRPLVRVDSGSTTIYMNAATARSLATAILRMTCEECDVLWVEEEPDGEEVDRWNEDVRAGAIGGNPA